jgi:L-ribulokinase
MTDQYIIGLDFGTASARGVRIDLATGLQEDAAEVFYRHGTMVAALADGRALPPGYALQNADDYLDAAESILRTLGSGRHVAGIGVDATASSPLPCRADGTPLSRLRPDAPHAYVKLWKHAAAQRHAEALNSRGGAYLDNFGGRLSGEWLLAKAAEIAADDPSLWHSADRFIESGDWIVWMLTGEEVRSLDFAAYKVQYLAGRGYPAAVPGLAGKLAPPHPAGTSAGGLGAAFRDKTGILGPAAVAVAAIDSHAVLPAVNATAPGTLVGAIGTSAAYLLVAGHVAPLPAGMESVADGAALPGVAVYEAGQAAFGDVLGWFVGAFPRGADAAESFARYNAAAAGLAPGTHPVLALDWWGGNRVPHADSGLSGLLVGLNLSTSGEAIYRALIEGLCFGTRTVCELMAAGGLPVDRLVLTSGLPRRNPLVVQIMADVLGRAVEVPTLDNPTAVGAAIHGAVAAGVVADFAEGGRRFGASAAETVRPNVRNAAVYDALFAEYRRLSADETVRSTMKNLGSIATQLFKPRDEGQDGDGGRYAGARSG